MDVILKHEERGQENKGYILKRLGGAFKAKVALEAVRAGKTISEISSKHGAHPNHIRQWRNPS